MSTKRRRASSWEYVVKRKGLLSRPISLTFTDEKEGDSYVARLECLLDAGVVPAEFQENADKPATVGDGIHLYIQRVSISESDKLVLDVIYERIGKVLLSQVDYPWAEKYVKESKQIRNLSPSTIRHHVGALARMLDWLCRRGDLIANPLRLLPKGYATYTVADGAVLRALDRKSKVDQERDRRLTQAEEEAIRQAMAGHKRDDRERSLAMKDRERLVLLFDLALETAMRLREMFTLSVAQVDLSQRTIFLDKTKNGDKRQIPLSSVAIAKLQPVLERMKANERLFPWWDGVPTQESLRKATSKLSRQFSRIFDYSKVVGLNFHDLRHEATSRFFERTSLSDLEIAKITGHRSPRMLMRYANLRGTTLAGKLW